MIGRIWRGRTPESQSEEYFEYLKKTGIEQYGATKGNRGVYVLRRTEKGAAEFLLLTLWESMDAIKEFAGPNPELAVYYPEDKEYLLELEPHVEHYECLLANSDPQPS